MATTCREAIEEVFKDNPGLLTKKEVIRLIYERYSEKPWKTSTIGDHLIGLSVNHPSGKHHPSLQKKAFLFYLGNGQYKILETQDQTDGSNKTGMQESLKDEYIEAEEVIGSDHEFEGKGSKKLNEKQWMTVVLGHINRGFEQRGYKNLIASQGSKLPYAYEILAYLDNTPTQRNNVAYETDILVIEKLQAKEWKPRVVVEGKLGSVTTHDAITYSQKALTHKYVHPYLRYGILLGDRKHYPLPGRLFRHGAYFDFMLSFKSTEPTAAEIVDIMNLLIEEVEASRNLEEILFNSRNPNRRRFTLLHKPLKLK